METISSNHENGHLTSDHRSEEVSTNYNDFQVIWSYLNYTVRNSWSQRLFKRIQGFKNIPKSRTILTNVSGSIKSGELVAFMGPSGAGKSTLLECIVGKRNVGRTGDVLICGENFENIEVAFVAQKNDMSSMLTVKESILFAAKLLIATKLHNKQIDSKSSLNDICVAATKNVISHLGLEVCEHNRVNNISGGQLKRLAIAQQLVANPRILVLDEPTSGLDSLSCFQVVELLRTLAKEEPKMAIMLTIHQPSFKVLNMFDKLYVLNQSGKCIYENKPILLHEAITKHGLIRPNNCNPADFIIEIAYGEHGSEVVNSLVDEHQSYYKTEFSVPNNCHELASTQANKSFPLSSHATTLCHRNILTTIRNPILFALRLVTMFVVPVFLLSLFGSEVGLRGGCPPKFDADFEPSQLDYIGAEIEFELKMIYNNIGNLFFLSLFIVFNAVMPTLLTFPHEMIIFKSEKANNWYDTNAFYFGNLLAEIPLQFGLVTLYWSIANSVQNQCNDWWRFSTSLVIHLLNSFITQTFGYLFGAFFMYNVPASVFLGPSGCIIPFMLLSGIFVKVKSLSPLLNTLSYVSYLRFAIEGFLVSIYGFNRCGDASQSLADGRDAFVVWMSAMLGIYSDTTESGRDSNSNSTLDQPTIGTPTERFVEELIDAISGKFVSDENQVRSAVMNEYDYEDWYVLRAIAVLFTYLIIIRLIAYIVISIKVRTNN